MVGRFALVLVLSLSWASVSSGQSSLSTQQDRCDRLRSEVDRARQKLDAQSRTSDVARETEDMVISAMRARGKSEQEVEMYRRTARMQRSWGGTEENARREHNAAMERYSMQGCSSGGVSSYNYNVE